jgi:hypothetical protein
LPVAGAPNVLGFESAGANVDGRIMNVGELTERDERSWRALAERAAQPNPLFEPDCIVPAAEHLDNGSAISLVLAEEDGHLFGCFPAQRVERWRAIRRPVLTSQVRRMQYDSTPLLDLDRGGDAMRAMLIALGQASRGQGAGLVVFDWLDDGPVSRHIRAAAGGLGFPVYDYHSWVRPIIHRRDDGKYRAIHSRKFLHNVSRLQRRMSDELGAEIECVDRRDDPGVIDTLIQLEGAGYKARTGVALAGHSDESAWFRDMCSRFREAGRLHVYTLEGAGKTVAIELGLRGGEGLFLLKVSYDEAFAKYTPGIQLHLKVLDRFDALPGLRWIDSCTYEDNQTMMRVYPGRRLVTSLVVAVGGAADRLLLRLVARGRRALGRQSAPPPEEAGLEGVPD